MPFIFSYGTLQQESVQLSTFGRLLHGQKDELRGFELSLVKIENPQVAAASGKTHHHNVRFNGREDSRVPGTVFEITDAELAAADKYEHIAAYKRIAVKLASGKQAWVYVDARSATTNDEINMNFSNVYNDTTRAQSYAKLEFPGTYYLAYRDLPAIITAHVRGTKALDFGCGAGRSTRFLRELGFEVVGVDISEHMLAQARERDPQGEYHLVPEDNLEELAGEFDLILSAFTFDNIPTMEKKVTLLNSLRRLLCNHGRLVNLVSSPEIYLNEWASFSTKDFPQNRSVQSEGKVLIVMLDVDDKRPVEDILCTDEDYRAVYQRAGLQVIKTYKPLAKASEPYPWVSETAIAPWVIYVLERME